MANKKQQEAATNAVTELMGAITKTVKDTSGDHVKVPTIKSLEDMVKHYETVDVRIRKKHPKHNKFAHFVTMVGQSTKDLEALGLEEVCRDQGGGGEYQILMKDPSIRNWSGAVKVEGVHVMGASYDIPRLERESGMGNAAGLPPTAPGYFPILGQAPQPTNFNSDRNTTQHIDNIIARTNEQAQQQMNQAERANNNMMMILQQSSDKQAQTQATMMTAIMAMMQGNQNKPGEQTEIRALQEKIDRMEQDRKTDEKFNAITRELAETKQALLLEASKSKNSGMNERDQLMLAMYNGQQNTNQRSTDHYLELFKSVMDRPTEDEKLSNIMGTMMKSQQSQMDLVGTAIRNNLLSGSGTGHPVADIIAQAVEGLTQVATVAYENKAADSAPGYETASAEVMPPYGETDYAQPDAQLGNIPTPQLEAETDPSPIPEIPSEPPVMEKFLSEDDIVRIQRDTALSQVIAAIQNGVSIGEATARLFAHARSGNDISIKWLHHPIEVTHQVLSYYELESKIEALANNIVKFIAYMEANGDPNEWSGTSYKPIKAVASTDKATSIIPKPEKPEFGVTQASPVTGEEYDSLHPKSITPPPVDATPQEPIPEITPEEPEKPGPETEEMVMDVPAEVAEPKEPSIEVSTQA